MSAHSRFVQKKGFTIVELLVVIVIIGLLTTVATVNYTAAQKRSRDNNRKTQVYSIAQAVEAYYGAKKDFPGLVERPAYMGTAIFSGSLRNCMMLDADNSVTYIYYPTVPVNASPQPYTWWQDCSIRYSGNPYSIEYPSGTYNQVYDPNWYKPAGSWIPGLAPYLNPQPADTRFRGFDGSPATPIYSAPSGSGIYVPGQYCNLLAARCRLTNNGAVEDPSGAVNQTQTFAYKHLANGYAVFTRLENTDADAVPVGTTFTDAPTMPSSSRTVGNDKVFMVRK